LLSGFRDKVLVCGHTEKVTSLMCYNYWIYGLCSSSGILIRMQCLETSMFMSSGDKVRMHTQFLNFEVSDDGAFQCVKLFFWALSIL
jgi:hypothetical protein